MEVVSSYTREQAVNDHVLIEIKAPLFNGNHNLKQLLQHNHSIVITGDLLKEFIEFEDDDHTVENFLQQMAMTMVSQVMEMKEKKVLQQGNKMFFNYFITNNKATVTKRIKSVTHIEPNYFGIEQAKCITFMKEHDLS